MRLPPWGHWNSYSLRYADGMGGGMDQGMATNDVTDDAAPVSSQDTASNTIGDPAAQFSPGDVLQGGMQTPGNNPMVASIRNDSNRSFITMSCYCERYGFPSDPHTDEDGLQSCLNCFTPETLIRTKTGYQRIETIKVGEIVLTHDGSWQKVNQVFKTHFDGFLKKIETSTTGKPIFCTANHPFLALDSSEHQHGLKWLSDNGKPYCTPGYCNRRKNSVHHIKWTDASDLTEKGWIVTVVPSQMDDSSSISIPPELRKSSKNKLHLRHPNAFEITEDFMWLAGMYIAEGSCNDRTVFFGLHKDEIQFQNRIIGIFNDWNINAAISTKSSIKSPNRAVVYANNSVISKWFPSLFGKGCQNKHIPEELMNVKDPSLLWALIQGIYDGDGTKRSNSITQTSEVLFLQISEILERLGELPVAFTWQGKDTINGNPRKLAFIISWASLGTRGLGTRTGRRWNFEENTLSRIDKITDTPYHGFVYNLEVNNTHSYIVQNIAVHNCGEPCDGSMDQCCENCGNCDMDGPCCGMCGECCDPGISCGIPGLDDLEEGNDQDNPGYEESEMWNEGRDLVEQDFSGQDLDAHFSSRYAMQAQCGSCGRPCHQEELSWLNGSHACPECADDYHGNMPNPEDAHYGTSSDFYNKGYSDRVNGVDFDEGLANLSPEYEEGFSQGSFYTETPQQSAPQHIVPLVEGEDEMPRNKAASKCIQCLASLRHNKAHTKCANCGIRVGCQSCGCKEMDPHLEDRPTSIASENQLGGESDASDEQGYGVEGPETDTDDYDASGYFI